MKMSIYKLFDLYNKISMRILIHESLKTHKFPAQKIKNIFVKQNYYLFLHSAKQDVCLDVRV